MKRRTVVGQRRTWIALAACGVALSCGTTSVQERPLEVTAPPPGSKPDPSAVAARVEAHVRDVSTTRPGGDIVRITDPTPTPTPTPPPTPAPTPPTSTPTPTAAETAPTSQAPISPTAPTSPPAAVFVEPTPTPAPGQTSITVGPRASAAPAQPPPSVAVTTDAPAAMEQPRSPTGVTSDVEQAVGGRLSRDRRDVSAALDAQLLAYLQEKPVPDPAALAELPAEDRELISAVMDALVNLRATVRSDPNAMFAAKARPVAELSERLKLRSDLSVPVIAICSDIRSFGVYEPAPQVLSPRGETNTRLYYEVANFMPRYTDKRMWETRLQQQLTLFDVAGRAVWSDKMQAITDLSRNRRQDFFIQSPLRLPPVPAGRYTLKATIQDLNASRVAEAVLAFESK
jgi:hypothetical protein